MSPATSLPGVKVPCLSPPALLTWVRLSHPHYVPQDPGVGGSPQVPCGQGDGGSQAQGWSPPPLARSCVTSSPGSEWGPRPLSVWAELIQMQATAQAAAGSAGGPWGTAWLAGASGRLKKGVCVSQSLGSGLPGPGVAPAGVCQVAVPRPQSDLGVTWLLGSALWAVGGGSTECPGPGGWQRAPPGPPGPQPLPGECRFLGTPSSGFQNPPSPGVGLWGESWEVASTGSRGPAALAAPFQGAPDTVDRSPDPHGETEAQARYRSCHMRGRAGLRASTCHWHAWGGRWGRWQLVHQDGFSGLHG